MNDNDLVTTLRESVADVHTATPVAEIVGRGRTVRAQRRILPAAGLAALVAGTALAVTTWQPFGHSAGGSSDVRLTAWTVDKKPNGDIDVTINQLNDPAGLQALLRADGLPVTVSFSGPGLSSACQPYDANPTVMRAVAEWNTSDGSAYLVIHPSALPSDAGVAIVDVPEAGSQSAGSGGSTPSDDTRPMAIGLVQASQDCTG
jgi:hypothetical protein